MGNKLSQSVSMDKMGVMTDNPLVSIITPTFNRIEYLEACLQSVLKQSYPNVEHIIVDGASTDGSVEMLVSYQANYPERIRFISEPDRCTEEALNKGFGMAKGEIVAWLGSDDTYEPDAIETVVKFFRANPDAYFVFGECNDINERGEVVGRFETRDFNLKEEINDKNCIPCMSAFYKREVIDKVGGYDTSLTTASDVDFFIRVGKVFPIYRISKVLSNFRAHEDKKYDHLPPRKLFRDAYIISRRHGGSLFSPCARRYFVRVLYDWLHPLINFLRPVLGFAYPFLWRLFYGRD